MKYRIHIGESGDVVAAVAISAHTASLRQLVHSIVNIHRHTSVSMEYLIVLHCLLIISELIYVCFSKYI